MDKAGSAISVVKCTGSANVWSHIPYPNRKTEELYEI